MATNRLLFSQQTCLISCGGYLKNTGTAAAPDYAWVKNDDLVHNDTKNIHGVAKHAHDTKSDSELTYNDTGGGFAHTMNWLLPVQSFSADETIPSEDVLVMGNKKGVHRAQVNVATGKCTVKAYLADYMSFVDGGNTRDAGIYEWFQHTKSTTDSAATETWDGSMAKAKYTDATGNTAYANVDTGGTVPVIKDTDTGANNVGADLQQYSASVDGPFPGITQKGYLAGEAWIQNGSTDTVRQGLLEQLVWEAIGGFEALVQVFNPSTDTGINDMDGVSFIGVLSSINIDTSKGGYPTLDLAFESVGELPYLNMGVKENDGGVISKITDAGSWYVKSCNPHTSGDVLVWGRDQYGNAGSGFTGDQLVLLAGNAQNFWAEDDVIDAAHDGAFVQPTLTQTNNAAGQFGNDNSWYGAAAAGGTNSNTLGYTMGNTDTLNSAKMSLDMPTETLSGLGNEVKGNIYKVRQGNRVFSKPPYKATMNLDGQGLKAAGYEEIHSSGKYIEKRIMPNEIQLGMLHCTLSPDGAATSARSMSQNVGDVGATYSVTVEGTMVNFFGTYQGTAAATADSDRDVAS